MSRSHESAIKRREVVTAVQSYLETLGWLRVEGTGIDVAWNLSSGFYGCLALQPTGRGFTAFDPILYLHNTAIENATRRIARDAWPEAAPLYSISLAAISVDPVLLVHVDHANPEGFQQCVEIIGDYAHRQAMDWLGEFGSWEGFPKLPDDPGSWMFPMALAVYYLSLGDYVRARGSLALALPHGRAFADYKAVEREIGKHEKDNTRLALEVLAD